MTDTPYLLFEFEDKKGETTPLVFQEPVQIFETDDLREVPLLFYQMESMLNEGYYAAGYVSYEAAPAFDESLVVHSNPSWPLLWFGVFQEPEVLTDTAPGNSFEVSSWQLKGDFHSYKKGMSEIKRAIERGDTYQVNYTTRLEASFKGDDYSFYRKLASNQRSSYSAYLNLGKRRVLSASPEMFFRIDQHRIKTKPMKGTEKRGRSYQEDLAQKKRLFTSEKDRSENLMIVDLIRNDLGRIAKPGTVKVPSLFDIETYPTVHQMTSTVEGELPQAFTMYEVFQALFPCGSITGAPKVRTMEYIEKLEESPRGVYCGAIGYITPKKEAVFNVPIRTVMLDEQKAAYGTGGGVTWDSTSEGEYEELHTKARLLTENRPSFELLETMKLEDGGFPLLSYHLKRAMQSAEYFTYPVDRDHVADLCSEISGTYSQGTHKVRLSIDSKGECMVEVKAIEPSPAMVTCSLAKTPVDENDPFLFHKTTHREVYERHNYPQHFSTLLWNTKGELTEFTIANLVIKDEGHYYTPPVESGLLAGTFRERLLEAGTLKEKVLYKDQIDQFDEIWMINGVRGWIKVDLVRE